MLKISVLIAGASTDGDGADVGSAALVAAGLPPAGELLDSGLAAEMDEMLALEGVFLIDGVGDLVDFDASVSEALDCCERLALAAASVDLG